MFDLAGGEFGTGDTTRELAPGNRLKWQQFKQTTKISPDLQYILHKALQNHFTRYQKPIEMYEDLQWLQQRTT